MNIIEIHNLTKSFRDGQVETSVLRGIDLFVEKGEFVAIMGRSGAGKSTLMYMMSLLDMPTGGAIVIDGEDAHLLPHLKRAQFRLHKFGFVFQDYALLPELTALENTALPLMMQGRPEREALEEARSALARVGLGEHFGKVPSQLSGGEQQRVSISRAIAHRPDILFADEPTANLDHESANIVMDIFKQLHAQGQTIIMVTHEEEYGDLADRIIRLEDGKVVR